MDMGLHAEGLLLSAYYNTKATTPRAYAMPRSVSDHLDPAVCTTAFLYPRFTREETVAEGRGVRL